jgi:UDP-N-acetyl-D-glucosamine 4,6-dehydratase
MILRGWLRPTAAKRTLFFFFGDLLLSLFTFYGAYLLRFNFHVPVRYLEPFWSAFLLLFLLKAAALHFRRQYRIVWRYFSLGDARRVLEAHLIAYTLFGAIFLLWREPFLPFPRSVLVIDFVLSFLALTGLRISKRLILESYREIPAAPALVLGEGDSVDALLRAAQRRRIPYDPVAVVVPDGDTMRGSYIDEIPVRSEGEIETLVARYGIRSVLLGEFRKRERLERIVERLEGAGIREFKRLRLLDGRDERLEDLSIEELLARRPQDLDRETIRRFIRGKRILVTGAGGSIGAEIVRQCRRFGARRLILVENGEYNLYRIGEEFPDAVQALVSVTDREALERLFERERPQIVIHAAAYKHVPICEANVRAAVRNNVLGTRNVIDVSIASGAEKVVVISTDKAVRPANVMGATKRIGELYAQNVDSGSTEIVAVRFGNVLGSSGSVIPKFKRQIERGGPVTVTHPEITRYFMLVEEACQLVLQAAAIARGGEIFILDMGRPVRILDLARRMIRLYGREGEVEIRFTGLRPGEKLYEELLLEERESKTVYRSIFIARSTPYPIGKLRREIEELLGADDPISLLRTIIPEYRPAENSEEF